MDSQTLSNHMLKTDPELATKLQARAQYLAEQVERAKQKYVQVRDELVLTQRLLERVSGKSSGEDDSRTSSSSRNSLSRLQSECLEILRRAGRPMKVLEITNQFKQRGIEPGSGTVSWTLRRLWKRGDVEKVSYGIFKIADKRSSNYRPVAEAESILINP